MLAPKRDTSDINAWKPLALWFDVLEIGAGAAKGLSPRLPPKESRSASEASYIPMSGNIILSGGSRIALS